MQRFYQINVADPSTLRSLPGPWLLNLVWGLVQIPDALTRRAILEGI